MNSRRRASFVVTAALAAVAAGASAALADVPVVPGHAIVARPEGDALNELVLEQPKLGKLTSVNVRVVYTKTGDVSPVYGTPTFAGVERYGTLAMTADDLKNDRDKWQEAAAGTGTLPAWVTFTVSGELPPR